MPYKSHIKFTGMSAALTSLKRHPECVINFVVDSLSAIMGYARLGYVSFSLYIYLLLPTILLSNLNFLAILNIVSN